MDFLTADFLLISSTNVKSSPLSSRHDSRHQFQAIQELSLKFANFLGSSFRNAFGNAFGNS